MEASKDPAYAAWGIDPNREDDTEWELDEGIPQFEDPFIQKYLDGRDALIQQEKQQRSDRLFREALSPTAFEACSIVDRIRFEESQTLWTSEYEDSLAKNMDIYPGMMFTLAKERMEKSKLWKIVRRMPKGALLHCHLAAMVDLDLLFEESMKMPGVCMKASAPLHTTDGLEKGTLEFVYTRDAPKSTSSIWSEQYEAGNLVALSEAADAFPEGGRDGFVAWLKSRFTITNDESLRHHEGVDAVWRKFTTIFPILNSLMFIDSIFRKLLRRLFQQLREDGIQYVELRHDFSKSTIRDTTGKGGEPDEMELLQIMDEELQAFQATEEGKDFWGARIIWSAIRRFSKRDIVASMKQCIRTKQAFPHLIAGFDFVGQEDLGVSLAELTTLVFWFRKQCAQAGINIPFFFHAGECLGDGDETDENLFDAMLLGTRRIGHGFSLYKHPLLIEMVKEKKILIESCPISNEVLRLCASIKSHPLPALLARGVACSLSNDDPALLGQGNCGVSHDFWQALQGWENLGLAGLGSLAENSVRWAAFEDEDSKEWLSGIKMGAVGKTGKAQKVKEWLASWEKFCLWIIDEFGSDEPEGDDDTG